MAKIELCRICKVLPERKWDIQRNGMSTFGLSCPRCKATVSMFRDFDEAIQTWNELNHVGPDEVVRGFHTVIDPKTGRKCRQRIHNGEVYTHKSTHEMNANGCMYCGDALIYGRSMFYCKYDECPYKWVWEEGNYRSYEEWYKANYPSDGDGFFVGVFGDAWRGGKDTGVTDKSEWIDDEYTEDATGENDWEDWEVPPIG